MVSIRLSRGGSKKRPFYHVVVTDSRSRRDGRYIERLGFFNPVANAKQEGLRINLERAEYWLGVGAQPSDIVSKLLKQSAKTTSSIVTKKKTVTEEEKTENTENTEKTTTE